MAGLIKDGRVLNSVVSKLTRTQEAVTASESENRFGRNVLLLKRPVEFQQSLVYYLQRLSHGILLEPISYAFVIIVNNNMLSLKLRISFVDMEITGCHPPHRNSQLVASSQ